MTKVNSGNGTNINNLNSDEMYHKPQSEMDKQAKGYENDVASSWLRGMGPGEAEGKPGYDKTGRHKVSR